MNLPDPTRPPATRLFAILARDAPVGVIFRRGPTRHVQLIKWQLGRDHFEYGQWFKGRIYERRCDLSPSGDLLLYFAAKYGSRGGAWTAISRPPYLTALALWHKSDSWGGGGMFERERQVALNHKPEDMELASGFRLAKSMQVRPYGDYPGRGEDHPIYHSLLTRGGWRLTDEGDAGENSSKGRLAWSYVRPQVYEKTIAQGLRLTMSLKGVGQRDGAWYWTDYRVSGEGDQPLIEIDHADWADFDGADLVYAKDGCLYRFSKSDMTRRAAGKDCEPKLIGDFRARRFEPVAAPRRATKW